MIDPKELAAALKGFHVRLLNTGQDSGIGVRYYITEVTTLPKKPEIRVKPIFAALDGEPYTTMIWYSSCEEAITDCETSTPSDPIIGWYRRETIDEIPQMPSVVEAK